MARETRGSAASANPVASDNVGPAAPKRKRQASSSTADAPRPITLKVTLPASTEEPTPTQRVKLNVSSPTKGEDQPEQGVKRQRISLKVKGGGKKGKGKEVNGAAAESADVEVEGQETHGVEGEDGGDETKLEVEDEEEEESKVVVQKKVVRALDKEVREALAVVLAKMATNLPRPINSVLTLFLPPAYTEREDNTLAYILKQDDLSWERLVEILHIFSTSLLQPCAYPTPFPPLSHIHTIIPPLPPQQPPHAIYNFCSNLRDIILSIEPLSAEPTSVPTATVERWGLMMKVPGGTEGRGAGEWWTGIADWRELEKIKTEDEGVLERLAGDGNKFGYAGAVSAASFAGTAAGLALAPNLGDCLIQKASLKAQRWKDQLARRKGGFGSHLRPVTVPRISSLPWTPTFGPSFDSNFASGGVGYWKTVEAMHQRNRYRSWTDAGMRKIVDEDPKQGYWGSLDTKKVDDEMEGEEEKAGQRGVEEVLNDNAAWLDELQGWQEIRVRNGTTDVGERERVLAEELLNSLSNLTSTISPSTLLPSSIEPGFAHTLSSRFIQTPGPVHRGILDHRRPRAIHDNTTIRSRPTTVLPPVPPTVTGPPSIAQQLAGTPNRSHVPNSNGYTPSGSGHQSSGQSRPNYAYAPNNSGSKPPIPSGKSGYVPTPPPGGRQPTYTHSPYIPGQLPSSNTGNTIYSRPAGPGGQQHQVMMSSPSPGAGGGLPSPNLPGVGMQGQYGRPGMPSGLRQSFGPGAEGSGSGQAGQGGYFPPSGRN